MPAAPVVAVHVAPAVAVVASPEVPPAVAPVPAPNQSLDPAVAAAPGASPTTESVGARDMDCDWGCGSNAGTLCRHANATAGHKHGGLISWLGAASGVSLPGYNSWAASRVWLSQVIMGKTLFQGWTF